MNVKKILFAAGFYHTSDAALSFASILAAESDALFYIVHVGNDTPSYLAGYYETEIVPNIAQQVARDNRQQLDQTKPTFPGVNFLHRYLTGNPEYEILTFADREEIDLIVVGSHGRTGIFRLLLGSVAEAVVRRAKCPVLTVKQPVEKVEDALLGEKSPPKPTTAAQTN